MQKKRKIIFLFIAVLLCFSLSVVSISAAAVDENFKGVFTLGTLYDVGDTVYYQGQIYRCLISNAIAAPNDSSFWVVYKSFNETYEFVKEYGYNLGINEFEGVTVEVGLGIYLNATLSIYRYNDINYPGPDRLIYTNSVNNTDIPSQKAIFSLLDINVIENVNGNYESAPNTYTINIEMQGIPDWYTYPFILRCTDSDIDLSQYMNVYFMNEDFMTNGLYTHSGNFTVYVPGSDNPTSYDIVQLRINDMSGLVRALAIDSNATNQVYISYNRTTQPFLTADLVNQIRQTAYNTGFARGESGGYLNGYSDGYDEGYLEGYDIGATNEVGFAQLFDGIANVPVTMVSSLLGFEIFGINLMSVFIGLLTILLVAFLIKRFV